MSQPEPTFPFSDSDVDRRAKFIIVHRNGAAPSKLPLDNPVMTVGRDMRSGVTLDDDAVSRLHSRLECEQGVWYITDLGSTNGTYLNQQRLPAYSPQPVVYNDKLRIGPFSLELEVAQKANRSSTPTVSVLPDVKEDAEALDEISLARQLFGGLEEVDFRSQPTFSLVTPKPAPKTMPYSFSLWPKVIMQNGQVIISILNEASDLQRFDVEVMGDHGVRCLDGVFSVEISSGAEQRRAVNIHATQRPLMGDTARQGFQVRIQTANGEVRESLGEVVVEPRLSTSLVVFISSMVIIATLAYLISFFLG